MYFNFVCITLYVHKEHIHRLFGLGPRLIPKLITHPIRSQPSTMQPTKQLTLIVRIRQFFSITMKCAGVWFLKKSPFESRVTLHYGNLIYRNYWNERDFSTSESYQIASFLRKENASIFLAWWQQRLCRVREISTPPNWATLYSHCWNATPTSSRLVAEHRAWSCKQLVPMCCMCMCGACTRVYPCMWVRRCVRVYELCVCASMGVIILCAFTKIHTWQWVVNLLSVAISGVRVRLVWVVHGVCIDNRVLSMVCVCVWCVCVCVCVRVCDEGIAFYLFLSLSLSLPPSHLLSLSLPVPPSLLLSLSLYLCLCVYNFHQIWSSSSPPSSPQSFVDPKHCSL